MKHEFVSRNGSQLKQVLGLSFDIKGGAEEIRRQANFLNPNIIHLEYWPFNFVQIFKTKETRRMCLQYFRYIAESFEAADIDL